MMSFANSAYETKSEAEGAFAAGFAQQMGDIGTIMVAVLSAVFFHHSSGGGEHDGAGGT